MAKKWCIYRIVCDWQFVEEFGQFLWTEVSREKVTPERELKEDAEADFSKLGFDVRKSKNTAVQCHDDIKKGKKWVRHIMQCSYFNIG